MAPLCKVDAVLVKDGPLMLSQVSVVSLANSAQAYISLKGTREVYAGPSTSATTPNSKSLPDGIPARTIQQQSTSPVTPLSARTFGTWTALSSIIRLYGAYHIHDKVVYELCLWTYALAFAHFTSEWLVFGTARLSRGFIAPMMVASLSMAWMLTQWGAYVK
jgi:hypothetical protein